MLSLIARRSRTTLPSLARGEERRRGWYEGYVDRIQDHSSSSIHGCLNLLTNPPPPYPRNSDRLRLGTVPTHRPARTGLDVAQKLIRVILDDTHHTDCITTKRFQRVGLPNTCDSSPRWNIHFSKTASPRATLRWKNRKRRKRGGGCARLRLQRNRILVQNHFRVKVWGRFFRGRFGDTSGGVVDVVGHEDEARGQMDSRDDDVI